MMAERIQTRGRPAWQKAIDAFRSARYPLALTGAGISVESGIPDFRSSEGLWRIFPPEEYATLEVFRANPEKAWRLYRALGEILEGKQPNPAHHALADLERRGRLQAVITQNIDGLHQMAGNRRVIEVHGEHRHVHCLQCSWRRPVSADDYSAPEVPACRRCRSPLKPNVVLFGEWVRDLTEVERLLERCDALLVVGTSAAVIPVAWLPLRVLERGGQVFEFNLEETELTEAAQFFFEGQAGEWLAAFAEAV